MSNTYEYPGNELIVFENATNWKSYFASELRSFIKGDVLEVGAGIGANTVLLNNANIRNWVLLEPDDSMSGMLRQKLAASKLPSNCSVITGTTSNLNTENKFDAIIYIDVLEHIEKDREELEIAATLLKEGGAIIVLSPAFNFLYSPFDKAIGHYRRYRKKMIKDILPSSLAIVKMNYYDTVGFFASFVNRLFLKQSYPSEPQVQLWDKWMIPVSKISDPVFFHSFGKSIVAIFKKKEK